MKSHFRINGPSRKTDGRSTDNLSLSLPVADKQTRLLAPAYKGCGGPRNKGLPAVSGRVKVLFPTRDNQYHGYGTIASKISVTPKGGQEG